MRVPPNERPTELSYVDLLAALRDDVRSDAIPKNIKDEAMAHVAALERLLEEFSA